MHGPRCTLPAQRRNHDLAAALTKRLAWAERAFFRLEARKMFRYENEICHQARHIVTVSETDIRNHTETFGLSKNVSAVPTGVDCEYFAPPSVAAPYRDLIFVGAMDSDAEHRRHEIFVENSGLACAPLIPAAPWVLSAAHPRRRFAVWPIRPKH